MIKEDCSMCKHYKMTEHRLKTKTYLEEVYGKDDEGNTDFKNVIEEIWITRTCNKESGDCKLLGTWVESTCHCLKFEPALKEETKDA